MDTRTMTQAPNNTFGPDNSHRNQSKPQVIHLGQIIHTGIGPSTIIIKRYAGPYVREVFVGPHFFQGRIIAIFCYILRQ